MKTEQSLFILGTICCRKGSKGVENKNTRPLAGKPLVQYTIDTAKLCNGLNDVIISTDSETIKAIGMAAGIFTIDRPAPLATDDASKWPVFIHALESYEREMGLTVDYIVDMDATAPLKISDDIDGAINMAIANPDADVVITAYEAESNPYFNMMETDARGIAIMCKKPDQPLVCRQHASPVYSLSPAAFVIKKQALYTYHHWSEATIKLYIMPRERAVDIDTEMDFRFVEFLLHAAGNNK